MSDIVEILQKDKEELQQKLTAITKELNLKISHLEEMIVRHGGTKAHLKNTIKAGHHGLIPLADAVRGIMQKSDKPLTPVEIRDELLKLIKDGKVKTKAKTPLYAVHTVLRAGINNGSMRKSEPDMYNDRKYWLVSGH